MIALLIEKRLGPISPPAEVGFLLVEAIVAELGSTGSESVTPP